VTVASDSTGTLAVTNTGTFAVQATLSAETTKVIGTVRNLGNAGATFDSTVGAGTAPTNQLVVGALYNSTEISPTTGQAFALQADSKGRLRNVIMDAAGNTRGANVNASNQLSVSIDGSSATNISTNVAQMNGVAVTMGNGVSGTGVQRVTIASDSTGTIAATQSGTWTTGTTPAVINVGQKTVSTSAVQISAVSTIPTNGIIVQALSTNSASIFVGGSGVTTSTGFELTAGQSMSFTCNLNTLYIISVASTTDKICYNVE
jgi:hypothetical protein